MQSSFTKTIAEPATQSICYHCGDECDNNLVLHDDKSFCCNGCQMVYSILAENNLDQFYKLNVHAGTSQKNRISTHKYDFLDHEATIEKLLDFKNSELSKVHFHLPQIHCSSCLWLLENLFLLNSGVIKSRVNFLKKQAFIDFDHHAISFKELVILLARIGFPPTITLKELDTDQPGVTDRSLYYKLGLAGFVFGNIMLLSFPEYLGIKNQGDDGMSCILGYLNLALILPVLLYSGKDYFTSAWIGIRQKHLNIDVPISLGILALFLRSAYEILIDTGAGYLDSLAGLIFFLLIGKWFQKLTYNKISFDRDYKSYFPIACNIEGESGEQQVTLDQLKKSHNVYIRNGELIPADAVLMEGEGKLDYSFITGESRPVEKAIGEKVYAGGRQVGGMIKVAIVKDVSSGYLTQLWNDSSFSKNQSHGSVSNIADSVASRFTIIILLIAFATFFYWLNIDISEAINAFSAVLIIACPCAVALTIPFTFGNALRILARKGIFIKNIAVFEGLNETDHVVFDKTGTLTIADNQKTTYQGDSLSEIEKRAIKSLAAQSIHPRSKLIFNFFENEDLIPVNNFKEEVGQGIHGQAKGLNIQIGSAAFISNPTPQNENSQVSSMIAINGAVKGAFNFDDNYRKDAKSIIGDLKQRFQVSMLSGDSDRERTKMERLFGLEADIRFSQSPQEKLVYIRGLQDQHKKVVMIGDGLNDAGALQRSDIGIALTDNTSHFTPASDIIMHGQTFPELSQLFSYSRLCVIMVYVAYAIALTYNAIGLSYAVQGLLSPVIAAILMPLSSITILVFGVLSSSWMAYRKGFL